MFKRDKRLIPDEEIIEIITIKDFHELLKQEHSLCLIYKPQWKREPENMSTFNLTLAHKITRELIKDKIFYAVDEAEKQSKTKNRLDRCLETEYLFSSWRKSGFRSFKIIKNNKTLKDYDSFQDALEELIPCLKKYDLMQGVQHKIKLSIMHILVLQIRRKTKRRQLCLRLVKILKRYKEKLEQKK
jgi:hypothetical protein